jgi:hypothetical protein
MEETLVNVVSPPDRLTTAARKKVLQAFVWLMCHVQFVLFTTKITKDTKVSDD